MGGMARFCTILATTALLISAAATAHGVPPRSTDANARPTAPGRRSFFRQMGGVLAAWALPSRASASIQHPESARQGGRLTVAPGALRDVVTACSPGAAHVKGWDGAVEGALHRLEAFAPDVEFDPLRPAGAPLFELDATFWLVRAEDLEYSPVLQAARLGTPHAAPGSLSRMPIVTLGQWALTSLGAQLGGQREVIEEALHRGKALQELRVAQAFARVRGRDDVALIHGHSDVSINVDWLAATTKALHAPEAATHLLRCLLADWLYGAVPTMMAERPTTSETRHAWRAVAGRPNAGPESLGRHADLLRIAKQRFGSDQAGLDASASKVALFVQALAAGGWPISLHLMREQLLLPGAGRELALSEKELFFDDGFLEGDEPPVHDEEEPPEPAPGRKQEPESGLASRHAAGASGG